MLLFSDLMGVPRQADAPYPREPEYKYLSVMYVCAAGVLIGQAGRAEGGRGVDGNSTAWRQRSMYRVEAAVSGVRIIAGHVRR